jgi:hypothetical protein
MSFCPTLASSFLFPRYVGRRLDYDHHDHDLHHLVVLRYFLNRYVVYFTEPFAGAYLYRLNRALAYKYQVQQFAWTLQLAFHS